MQCLVIQYYRKISCSSKSLNRNKINLKFVEKNKFFTFHTKCWNKFALKVWNNSSFEKSRIFIRVKKLQINSNSEQLFLINSHDYKKHLFQG
jgi:hypothetical protein